MNGRIFSQIFASEERTTTDLNQHYVATVTLVSALGNFFVVVAKGGFVVRLYNKAF